MVRNTLVSSFRFVALAALAFALFAGPASAQQAVKIAVVDLDYVVANSPAGKALGDKLQAFQQQVQTEGEAMAGTAREIRQRMADGVNSLSEEKLAELQQQFEDASLKVRRFQENKQREGQKMQNDGLREIETQLEPVFKAIRDDNGYDLILNNVPGVVIMAGDRVNITQQVIDRLGAGGQ